MLMEARVWIIQGKQLIFSEPQPTRLHLASKIITVVITARTWERTSLRLKHTVRLTKYRKENHTCQWKQGTCHSLLRTVRVETKGCSAPTIQWPLKTKVRQVYSLEQATLSCTITIEIICLMLQAKVPTRPRLLCPRWAKGTQVVIVERISPVYASPAKN